MSPSRTSAFTSWVSLRSTLTCSGLSSTVTSGVAAHFMGPSVQSMSGIPFVANPSTSDASMVSSGSSNDSSTRSRAKTSGKAGST